MAHPFGASNAIDFHTIARDDGTGNYPGSWDDASGTGNMNAAGSHADPVCYTRSGTADGNVYYSFNVTLKSAVPLTSNNSLYIVEPIDVDTGLVLGKGYALPNDAARTLTAEFTSATYARLVSYVDRGFLDVQWLVSPDNGVTWTNAGNTSDKVYVLNADPYGLSNGDVALNSSGNADPTAPVAPLLETVIDIGCRSAIGQTASVAILNAVWSAFAAPASGPPNVVDASNRTMSYWGAHSGPSATVNADFFTVAGLCKNDDGRCQSWAQLLVAVLAAQGIGARQVVITPKSYESLTYSQMMNAQTFDATALPAQGNAKPATSLANHAVVTLVGADAALAPFTIFDPSYGKKYAPAAGQTTFLGAEQAWETATAEDIVYSSADGLTVPYLKVPVTPAVVTGSWNPFSFTNIQGVSI